MLKKHEHLKNKQELKELFKKGHSLYTEGLKMIYLHRGFNKKSTKIAVSVPKKFIKKASDRNQIKRRIKSAYRLNRQLLNSNKSNYSIFFIWMKKELTLFRKIEQLIKKNLCFLKKTKT